MAVGMAAGVSVGTSVRLSAWVLLAATLACASPAAAQKPAGKPPARPAAPATQTAPASSSPIPGGSNTCDYVTPDEAKGLLGADVAATTAPSKGLFTSCGYSSPTGDTVTVYVADYGLPVVAQQFFEKTRAELKTTTNEATLGVPAFSHVTAPTAAVVPAPAAGTTPRMPPPASQRPPQPQPPTGPAATPGRPGSGQPASGQPAAGHVPSGANAPPATGVGVGTPGAVMLLAVKDHRTVKLEASGPTAGQPQQLPKLRAIVTRVLNTLPAVEQPR